MKLSAYREIETSRRASTLGRIGVIAGAHLFIIGGGYLVTKFGSDLETEKASMAGAMTWSSQSRDANERTVDSAADSLFDPRAADLRGYNAGEGRSQMLASNNAPQSGRFTPRRPSDSETSSASSADRPSSRQESRDDEVLRPINRPGTGGEPSGRGASDAAGGETGMIRYTVQNGDSIYAIARRFDVQMGDIISANPGIKANTIRVGQTLNVPRSSGLPTSAATEAAAPRQRSASAESGSTYTVKKGDSLSRIASRQGVTVAELRAANNLSSDLIRVGQELKIPSSTRSSELVSKQHRGPKVTVQAGDTLDKIAAVHGVSVSELMELNEIDNPRLIRIGQVILIPEGNSQRRSGGSETRAAETRQSRPQQSQPASREAERSQQTAEPSQSTASSRQAPAEGQNRPLRTLDSLESQARENLPSLDTLEGEFSEEDLDEQPLVPIQE